MRTIKSILDEHFAQEKIVAAQVPAVEKAARIIIGCLESHGKVLICGNGGSAADCQHFAAELVGRFQKERRGLPAIALTTDSSVMTSISNDYTFEKVFARQVAALATKQDVLIGITTSGNSRNILLAVDEARSIGMKTITLNGKDGGALLGVADVDILIGTPVTARVQEMHILLIHILCELIEESVFHD